MTVKVVGEDPAAVKQTVCRNCAAKLEYTLADTVTETRRDYGGGSDTVRVLTCPRCHGRVIVHLF